MSDFWKSIENRRKLLGISRAEMARRAGISESTVAKGFKLKRKPHYSVRQQVERVLNEEEREQEAAA